MDLNPSCPSTLGSRAELNGEDGSQSEMKLIGPSQEAHTYTRVEQSNGPSYPLLHVTHGWTWELALSFQFCFLVTTPWVPPRLAPAHLCFPRLEGEIPGRPVGGQAEAGRGSIQKYQLGERVGQLCSGMEWWRLVHLTEGM